VEDGIGKKLSLEKWKIGEKEKVSLSYILKSYSDFEKMVKFGVNSYKGK
jgi:hypothetical protein